MAAASVAAVAATPTAPADAEPVHPLEDAFHRAEAEVERLKDKPGMAGVFRSRWEFLSEEHFRANYAMVQARMRWMEAEPESLYVICMNAFHFFEHQDYLQVEVQRHSARLEVLKRRINRVHTECKEFFSVPAQSFRQQAEDVRWILDPHSYREVAALNDQGLVTNPDALRHALRNRWPTTAYCAYQTIVACRQWNSVIRFSGNVRQFHALGCTFTDGNMNICDILQHEMDQLFGFKDMVAKRQEFAKSALLIYNSLYQVQAQIETEFLARVGLPSMAAELVTCIGEYAFGLKVGPDQAKIHAPEVPRNEDKEDAMQTQ